MKFNSAFFGFIISFCQLQFIMTCRAQGASAKAISATFAVISDYGSNSSDEAAVANLVKSWQPQFIITAGDNNVPYGAAATIDINIGKYFHDYIKPYTGVYGNGASVNSFFPTLGNHDLMTSNGAPYFQYFTLPGNERYYDFVNGDVHFFAINSNPSEPDGSSNTSTQATWLKNKLAASNSIWKVVYFHHSPFCSDTMHGSQTWMQWPFKEWGADAVISGHSHVYERIITGGFPYFVVGLGGQSIYGFNAVPVSGSQKRYNQNYGALKVTVTSDSLTFRFYNIAYSQIDSYTLVKQGVQVKETESSFSFKVFPNPNTVGKFTILNSTSGAKIKGWEVYNVYGETIYSSTQQSTNSVINISNQPNGIYFLNVKTESESFTQKLVIQR